MSDRMTLPVLPLRDAVLFPGVATPIGAGRPATLRAIEAALKQADRTVFAVAQKENIDQVTPGVLYTTGTIARISVAQSSGYPDIDRQVERMVAEAIRVCRPGGHFHVIDAILPVAPNVFKTALFRLDRGNHPRTLAHHLAVIGRAARIVEHQVLTGPLHDTAYARLTATPMT